LPLPLYSSIPQTGGADSETEDAMDVDMATDDAAAQRQPESEELVQAGSSTASAAGTSQLSFRRYVLPRLRAWATT